jgi:hypothetical protein
VSEYNALRKHQKLNNPESVRAYWLKSRYGIGLDEYNHMLALQGGKCAICERVMDSPKLDHNHETGEPRQLLCNNCNCGIGFLQDDRVVVAKALAYLERWKANR